MSGETGNLNNDSVMDPIESIREEVEELVACENAHPVSSGYLASKSRSIGEWIASRPWGQVVFKSVDRLLWCIERTMLWQNPSPDTLVPMVRPVNALVAYPLAALLWVLQHLMFVGGEGSSASELIKWVQTRRRRLRAVRFQGIRNMRINNVLGRPKSCSSFSQVFWFLGLLPAEKEYEVDNAEQRSEEQEIGVATEDADSEQNKKRRYSDLSAATDEVPVALLLDEEYHSDSDSDYVPECSHSSETSDSEDVSSTFEDEEETEAGVDESSAAATATEKLGDLSTEKQD